MTIKKFKYVKDAAEISFTSKKEDGTLKTVSEVHETKPHPDLLQSLANLRVHFGLLTGYLPFKAVKKIETPADDLVDSFNVHAISVKTGDDPGVVLTGQKTLENGKKVTVNSPFTRFGEGEETAYKFLDDLEDKINRATVEIEAYQSGEKKADEPQQSLPFGENGNTRTNEPENLEFEEVASSIDDGEVWEGGKRPQ
jgi:hypothetical protein